MLHASNGRHHQSTQQPKFSMICSGGEAGTSCLPITLSEGSKCHASSQRKIHCTLLKGSDLLFKVVIHCAKVYLLSGLLFSSCLLFQLYVSSCSKCLWTLFFSFPWLSCSFSGCEQNTIDSWMISSKPESGNVCSILVVTTGRMLLATVGRG